MLIRNVVSRRAGAACRNQKTQITPGQRSALVRRTSSGGVSARATFTSKSGSSVTTSEAKTVWAGVPEAIEMKVGLG